MGNLLTEKNMKSAREDLIVTQLKQSLVSDGDWIDGLLKAICEWTVSFESLDGFEYQYLILGEGLDWLRLADRLISEVADMIPEDELGDLLFYGRLPERFDKQLFKEFIGPIKYGFYLNYWYGVIVEEAIQNAIERDIRKRHLALCYQDHEDLFESVFGSLYGESRETLMNNFWAELGKDPEENITTTRSKEFTYWLHKIRVNRWDPARVASDTKRGILELEYYGIYPF